MRKFITFFRAFAFATALGAVCTINAQSITENFDDITTLTAAGWVTQNLSSPVGTTNWFQGTSVAGGGPFDAYNGAASAYIGANYNNTTGGTGIISNWLIMPNRTLRNGDVLTFYSRKPTGTDYPDRLEVRMSPNGLSTSAGLGSSVGDFTILLFSINPTLVTGVYPTAWTLYTVTISGLPAPTSGRLAFRYYVTGAGPTGTNSDYIGIDAVNYTPYVCPTLTITPATLPDGVAGTTYTQTLGQTGALEAYTYSVTAGAVPPGLSLSAAGDLSGDPTATSTYNFTVSVSDASGCSGSGSYSMTIACPTNGATLSAFPSLCSYDSPYTLVEGSPAGGTYSGTGVSGGQFDPSQLTQSISYSLTDAYGCFQTVSQQITVNTPPVVSASASVNDVCIDGATITLTASPLGGSWTGAGVSGSDFSPAIAGSGVHNLIYSYTDGNLCSASDTTTVTVSLCVGVEEQIDDDGITIYPNPSNGSFYLNLSSETMVKIFNTQGQLILSEPRSAGASEIDLTQYPNGIYQLSLTINGKVLNKRIIKQ